MLHACSKRHSPKGRWAASTVLLFVKTNSCFSTFALWKVSNFSAHIALWVTLSLKRAVLNLKKKTFLVVTLLRLEPLCQDRFQENQRLLSRALDLRFAFLPILATPHRYPMPGEQREEKAQTCAAGRAVGAPCALLWKWDLGYSKPWMSPGAWAIGTGSYSGQAAISPCQLLSKCYAALSDESALVWFLP